MWTSNTFAKSSNPNDFDLAKRQVAYSLGGLVWFCLNGVKIGKLQSVDF